jgi:hypothetical protein
LVDFGDGTRSNESAPLHTYAAPGTYPVRLTITDSHGLTDTTTIDYTAFLPPDGDRVWSPAIPHEGQTLTFSPEETAASGRIVGWQWQVDPPLSTAQTEQTTIAPHDNGTLSVVLRMTNHHLLSRSITRTVTVANSPPTAAFTEDEHVIFWNQEWGTDLTIQVDDPGITDRTTLICDWESGDGQTIHIPNCTDDIVHPPLTYDKPGTYIATLTVTDKDGGRASDQLKVMVEKRASRVFNYPPRIVDEQQVELRARLFDQPDRRGLPLAMLSDSWWMGRPLLRQQTMRVMQRCVFRQASARN